LTAAVTFTLWWMWRTGDSVFTFLRIVTSRYTLSSWREC
jgi:hypothetical protein